MLMFGLVGKRHRVMDRGLGLFPYRGVLEHRRVTVRHLAVVRGTGCRRGVTAQLLVSFAVLGFVPLHAKPLLWLKLQERVNQRLK